MIESLIEVGMHAARSLECVEPGVLELPTQEVIGEGLGTGEIFRRQILLTRLGAPVAHVRGAVQEGADA